MIHIDPVIEAETLVGPDHTALNEGWRTKTACSKNTKLRFQKTGLEGN